MTIKLVNPLKGRGVKWLRFLTSNMTGHHRGPKRKLRAGYRVPSLKQTSCYKCCLYNARHVAIIFLRQVWRQKLQHRSVFSLHDACIWSSGIILIPYATFASNFVLRPPLLS